MGVLETIFYLQGLVTTSAVIVNVFFVYIVLNHTKNNIGKYKYLLIGFSCFETVYAVFVFIGMPTHFVSQRNWLVFTHGGFIGDTSFAILGPGLYCTFYEIWLGLVVIHFIYRYIVLCKEQWVTTLQKHASMRCLVFIVFLSQVIYSAMCGFYFCTREKILPELAKKVRIHFGIEKPEEMAYILLRATSADGSISPGGLTTIINHYALVGMSMLIIIYCGIRIWRAIQQMQHDSEYLKEAKVQRQLFFSLVVQTAVPIVITDIPTAIYLTFPFWESEFFLGALSPGFSLLTSLNKFFDPIIVLLCISEYRRAAFQILCCGLGQRRTRTVSSSVETPPRKGIVQPKDVEPA